MALRLRVALWGLAIVAAVVPLSARLVEQVYSRGIYPVFQPLVTRASNLVPVALLDIGLAVLAIAAAARFASGIRRQGWRRASMSLGAALVTLGPVVYLLFLASWGLNYRRVPLEAKLNFDRSRITREAAVRLAHESIGRLNAGYASAHANPFRPALAEEAFAGTLRALGGEGTAVTGRPKRSLFGLYFRQAAIDGLTVPVFLEIILNPDLLPVERPSVLLHEWAHLAGYADESEASFVAWIAGIRSEDPLAQYSAWLDAYRLTLNTLPGAVRAGLPPLAPGPRADLTAIAARYHRSSPVVRRAARGAYDSYLKANRIEEGIANYGVVLQLMLGTAYHPEGTPRLR